MFKKLKIRHDKFTNLSSFSYSKTCLNWNKTHALKSKPIAILPANKNVVFKKKRKMIRQKLRRKPRTLRFKFFETITLA